MTAAGLERGVLEVGIHRVLFVEDGGGGLEGDAEVDGFSVADAALHAAGAVGRGADLAVHVAEGVVVVGAGEHRAAEARANLEALRRRQA